MCRRQSIEKKSFQFYPEMYPNRKGSMASFSFRLLLAELPSYLGQPKLAIDKLTEISLISAEVNCFDFCQWNLRLRISILDKRFLWKGASRSIRILAATRKSC